MMGALGLMKWGPTGREFYRQGRRGEGRSSFDGDDEGQMTIELCVVFPVVIVLALILVNALTFFGDCAAFDRICRNAVRLNGAVVPGEISQDEVEGMILAQVEESMEWAETSTVECSTSGSLTGGGYMTATLTYRYEPTLFGMALRSSLFGVSLPSLTHSISLVVDPYIPGKWLSTFT